MLFSTLIFLLPPPSPSPRAPAHTLSGAYDEMRHRRNTLRLSKMIQRAWRRWKRLRKYSLKIARKRAPTSRDAWKALTDTLAPARRSVVNQSPAHCEPYSVSVTHTLSPLSCRVLPASPPRGSL